MSRRRGSLHLDGSPRGFGSGDEGQGFLRLQRNDGAGFGAPYEDTAVAAPTWPSTAPACLTAFGWGTWTSAWLCDEASGSLVDSIGGITLDPTGSVAYQTAGPLAGDFAIELGPDGATEYFRAASGATYDDDGTQAIAIYLCVRVLALPAAQRYISGKMGDSKFYGLPVPTTGRHAFTIFNGTTTNTSEVAINHVTDGLYHDVLACSPRSPAKVRVATDLGVGSDTVLTATGTLAGAGRFALGRNPSITAQCRIAFAAVATGAGVADLYNNQAAAIANIRAYTGR